MKATATGVLARVAAVATLLATTSSPIAGSAQSSLPAQLATFGNPTVSGIQGWGFEQDLRLDRGGRIYTSAPGTIAAALSFMYRSLDGGQTFKLVPAAVQPQGKLALTCPAGGGDTELATDPAGNLYFADLYAANFATARSSDQGRTFAASCTGVFSTPDDRQWYAVDGNPMAGGSITLTYNLTPNATPLPNPQPCAGNVLVFTRSPVGVPASAGIEYGLVQPVTQPCDGNEGIMGNDEVFTYPNAKRVFVIHDNDALDQIRMGRCDIVDLSVTSPTGYANCIDIKVTDPFPNGITGANFPTLTIDRAGNLFAVWEQAGYNRTAGEVTSDTYVYYAVSTNQGETWNQAKQIPTPNLPTNVFAWPVAGDAGRVDVAWYGTASSACLSSGHCQSGPDSVTGDWGLYVTQSLNFTSVAPTWSAPVIASEHFIHHGSMFTLIGSQKGDRTLGDFLQLRSGPQGEAVISYSDSNSIVQEHASGVSSTQGVSQGMTVRQNGGPSLFTRVGTVHGPALRINSVQVGGHAATLDSEGMSSGNQPNLEILGSQMSMPNASTYRIKMLVADLRSLAPNPDIVAKGSTLVWDTQWKVPSSTDFNGGAFFHTYMESTGGAQPPTFWVGQNAVAPNGLGLQMTYPGNPPPAVMVTGSYTPTAPGVITIDVPKADVTEPGAINNLLYSVTTASMTLAAPAESVPNLGGAGGVLFNLVDPAPAYDFSPAQPTPPFSSCHEGDGDGQVRGAQSGNAGFHLDSDRCEDGQTESVDEQDPGSGTDFHSSDFTGVTFDDVTHSMTIVGNGNNAGRPVTFTMVALDNGVLPGVFSLTLSDGYSVSGSLLSGGIQLR